MQPEKWCIVLRVLLVRLEGQISLQLPVKRKLLADSSTIPGSGEGLRYRTRHIRRLPVTFNQDYPVVLLLSPQINVVLRYLYGPSVDYDHARWLMLSSSRRRLTFTLSGGNLVKFSLHSISISHQAKSSVFQLLNLLLGSGFDALSFLLWNTCQHVTRIADCLHLVPF